MSSTPHYDTLVLVLSELGPSDAHKLHRPQITVRMRKEGGLNQGTLYEFYRECVARQQAEHHGEQFRFKDDVMSRLQATRSNPQQSSTPNQLTDAALEDCMRKLYLHRRGASFVFDDIWDWHQAGGHADSPFKTRKLARDIIDAAIAKSWLRRQDGNYVFARVTGAWRAELAQRPDESGDLKKVTQERDEARARAASLEQTLQEMCKALSG